MKSLARAIFILALSAAAAFAAPCKVGDKIDSFQAKDQHGNAFAFAPANTRYLLASFDMETGKKANKALDALGKAWLPSKNAVFLANIHGMPAIGRTFAMPKMRRYAHRIILGDDAHLMARYPSQAGRVTVLQLASGKVAKILYWDPATQDITALIK